MMQPANKPGLVRKLLVRRATVSTLIEDDRLLSSVSDTLLVYIDYSAASLVWL